MCRAPFPKIQKAIKTVQELAALALDALDALDKLSPSTGATGGMHGVGSVGPLSRLASSSLTALREMVSSSIVSMFVIRKETTAPLYSTPPSVCLLHRSLSKFSFHLPLSYGCCVYSPLYHV